MKILTKIIGMGPGVELSMDFIPLELARYSQNKKSYLNTRKNSFHNYVLIQGLFLPEFLQMFHTDTVGLCLLKLLAWII